MTRTEVMASLEAAPSAGPSAVAGATVGAPAVRVEELRRSYGVDEATTILFERPVPVAVRRAGREPRVEELTLRIALTQPTAGGAMHKTLRVALTSEADPFFLHSFDVTEEGACAPEGRPATRPCRLVPPFLTLSPLETCAARLRSLRVSCAQGRSEHPGRLRDLPAHVRGACGERDRMPWTGRGRALRGGALVRRRQRRQQLFGG